LSCPPASSRPRMSVSGLTIVFVFLVPSPRRLLSASRTMPCTTRCARPPLPPPVYALSRRRRPSNRMAFKIARPPSYGFQNCTTRSTICSYNPVQGRASRFLFSTDSGRSRIRPNERFDPGRHLGGREKKPRSGVGQMYWENSSDSIEMRYRPNIRNRRFSQTA